MSNQDHVPEIQTLVANRVLSHAQAKSENFSFDPFTIMAICNCIISVVKLLYMCYSKDGAAKAVKKNSIIHSLLLKREIRKRFKSKEDRKTVFAAFNQVGKSLSESELHKLIDSIQE